MMKLDAKKFNLILIVILIASSLGAVATSIYALGVYEKRSLNLVNTKIEIVGVNTKIDN